MDLRIVFEVVNLNGIRLSILKLFFKIGINDNENASYIHVHIIKSTLMNFA